MKNNLTQVLTCFICELNISVTGQSINEELEKHPYYPSLLAISDVLNNFRVPNAAYQLDFEELFDIPGPFIALCGRGREEFVLVKHLNKQKAIVVNERWNNHTLSIEEFKSYYGEGSVLIAEKDASSGEADYIKKRRKERLNNLRTPFVISGCIIAFAFLLFNSSYFTDLNYPTVFLTFFKTAGLITAILLLIQSIDANNPLIQKLCGGDNNKNCNAILSSKAAKISDELSWSEAGFFYFAGTWLALLFSSKQVNIMQVLAILNLVSLPYTFYSIYYQARVIKQWCVLCCAVQSLLWLEFFAFLPYLLHGITLADLGELSSSFIEMAIPVFAWVFIKPYLLQAKQIQPLKQQLRVFKYNTELFQKSLNEEPQYALPNEEHSIILGNREAEHVITMVSNPYCQPCAKAHKTLDEWLANREDIKLQVVFAVGNTKDAPKTQLAKHLLTLGLTQDEATLKGALNDWYERKYNNYASWAKIYPTTDHRPVDNALTAQNDWCDTVNIEATPTIFINGRKLPSPYQPEDIKYFI